MEPTAAASYPDVLPRAAAALAIAAAIAYAVAFDQGPLASLVTQDALESGGALHAMFHDARHLLGVPCH